MKKRRLDFDGECKKDRRSEGPRQGKQRRSKRHVVLWIGLLFHDAVKTRVLEQRQCHVFITVLDHPERQLATINNGQHPCHKIAVRTSGPLWLTCSCVSYPGHSPGA